VREGIPSGRPPCGCSAELLAAYTRDGQENLEGRRCCQCGPIISAVVDGRCGWPLWMAVVDGRCGWPLWMAVGDTLGAESRGLLSFWQGRCPCSERNRSRCPFLLGKLPCNTPARIFTLSVFAFLFLFFFFSLFSPLPRRVAVVQLNPLG